jgi:hypothetical protein
MADFFFFTDVDLPNEQQHPQAFGPAGTSGGMDVFNVIGKHTAVADPNAYAIYVRVLSACKLTQVMLI